MNERIKELAEQVGFGSAWFMQSAPGCPALPKEGMLKEFAELIVRECAEVVQEGRWMVPPSQEQLARSIKQHFGVE